MTRPSDYWPGWFFKRLSRSYVDELLAHHRNGPFENVVEQEIKLILHEVRWKAAMTPWLTLFKSAKRIPGLIVEKINGRYRRTLAKVRGSSDAPSSDGTGAGSSAVPVSQGAFTGYAGGFAGIGTGGLVGAPTPISITRPFEDAGILAGEIVAYRCWILKEDGLLYSAYRSEFVWPPKLTVEGDPSDYGAGIHAFKNRNEACQYIGMYEDAYKDIQIVSGTVDLWGEVYEHARGYRAQYAEIASIDESPNYDAAKLRKLYGLNKKRKKKATKE